MVYDGTKSGLNAVLYAPWFALPTADAMNRWVAAGSWLVDNDFEDMFLNFPLHPNLQKLCGIDLSQFFLELSKNKVQTVYWVWLRNTMGLTSLPYCSCQTALLAKQMIMGDWKEEDNVYHLDHVQENLPFSEDYNVTVALLRKV